jgi:hypothetical protein
MASPPWVMPGPWTPARSPTSGARSQTQETCLAQGDKQLPASMGQIMGCYRCPSQSALALATLCTHVDMEHHWHPRVLGMRFAKVLWLLLCCRMYATAAARSDGLLLLCGGRDVHGTPLADAYGFARHRDGRWEWHAAPGSMPSGRYQHGSVFVGTRLHISGGAVGGGRMVRCLICRVAS